MLVHTSASRWGHQLRSSTELESVSVRLGLKSQARGLVNKSRWHDWGTKRRMSGAGLACLLTAGCNRGLLAPVGPVGSAEKTILINSTAIMLAIVIPVIVAT